MIDKLIKLNRKWFLKQFWRIHAMERPVRQSFRTKRFPTKWDYKAEANALLLYRMEKQRIIRDYVKVDSFLKRFKK